MMTKKLSRAAMLAKIRDGQASTEEVTAFHTGEVERHMSTISSTIGAERLPLCRSFAQALATFGTDVQAYGVDRMLGCAMPNNCWSYTLAEFMRASGRPVSIEDVNRILTGPGYDRQSRAEAVLPARVPA